MTNSNDGGDDNNNNNNRPTPYYKCNKCSGMEF